MRSDDPVITLHNVRKTFGERLALEDVSLAVNAHEMIGLIGASGSGKSTLLRLIGGLATIDGGEIAVFGEAVQSQGRITARMRDARTRIGFVFQQFNLVGRLNLFSNAALGALGRIGFWRGLLGLWPSETRTAAMSALARVGIADRAAQKASTLSGGQQQRGAIARVLVQQARVILADEPVASLDPVQSRRVMEILRELNREDGLTVVVTLHQVDHARRYCDRVLALKDGRIVYDGRADGLDAQALYDIYGPEIEDAHV